MALHHLLSSNVLPQCSLQDKSIFLKLQTDKPIMSLPVFLGLRSAIIMRVIRITTASRSTAAADPTPAVMAAIKEV